MKNDPQQYQPRTGLAIGLLIALLVIFWWIFHSQFVQLLLWVATGFIKPMQWLVGWATPEPGNLARWLFDAMDPRNIKQLKFMDMMHLYAEIGKLYRWPLGVLMAILAWRAWQHPILHLNTSHNLESLIAYQSKIWKAISPIVRRDLTNDVSPEWRPSRSSADVAKEEGLVHAQRLKIVEAWQYFERQLGDKWGVALKDHEKAMFAIFAARICRDRKTAERLLDIVNSSCLASGLPSFDGVLSAYEQYRVDPRVVKVIQGHRYVRTVLFEMLVQARRFDGKLPTSHFLWLKPVDRTLWYALDRAPVDYGRLTVAAFSEGAAVAGQWQAESVAKKSGYQMGQWRTERVGEKELKFHVEFPYLINVLAGFAVDLEGIGAIDFPPEIMAQLAQNSANERIRFNIVRDRYVAPGVDAYLQKHVEVLRETAKKQAGY